tara:strand:+ start:286 stop:552 length:267 start_codon:yes stop_codon:yes gene_type:complete
MDDSHYLYKTVEICESDFEGSRTLGGEINKLRWETSKKNKNLSKKVEWELFSHSAVFKDDDFDGDVHHYLIFRTKLSKEDEVQYKKNL